MRYAHHDNTGKFIGAFCIDAIPNQPQVAHCHSFFVADNVRGQGKAIELKRRQMAALIESGYDYATCTTAADNARQRAVLERAGWSVIAEFKNRNTGSGTIVWGWTVREPA